MNRRDRPQILIWGGIIAVPVFLLGLWGIASTRLPKSASSLETTKQAQAAQEKTEGNQWLLKGIRLEKAETARVTFSPNGLWLVGGEGEAALWNSRTGKYIGKFGELSNNGIYKSYVRVDFISNQEISWASRNNILIFNLKLGITHQVLKRPSYRSFEAFAKPSSEGVWSYVPDLYDTVPSIAAPKGQRQSKARLRFLNLNTGKFTNELSLSLTYPASIMGQKVKVDVTLKYNQSWLVVELQDSRIFVLDKNYKIIWQEGLGFLTDEGANLTKLPIVFDFEVNSSDHLLLLDRDVGLRQVNLKNGKELKPWPIPITATSFAVSSSGKLWAFGNKDGQLILVDAATRKLIKNVILPFSTDFLEFSPDEEFIVAGGNVILPISS